MTKACLLPALVLALAAGSAAAVLLPGGGGPRSDCYLEFDVQAHEISARAAECTDGDPACDLDGACDGSCRFGVAVCLNQRDPAVPNCTPPPALLRASERGFDQVGLRIPSFASSACGAFVSVDTLALSGRRAGRRVRTVAVSPGRPKRDRDVLRLVCRPPRGGCPTTTTTSTTPSTTTSSESTTTVSVSTTTSLTTGTFPSSTTTVFGSTTTSASTTTLFPPTTTTLAETSLADTGIFSGDPDGTLGTFAQVFVGNDTTNAERALLRFDLFTLPAGATVLGCALEIHVVTLNEAGPGKIYRVKQAAWSESAATWNRYDGVHAWTTPGAFSLVEAASDVVVSPGADGPVAYAPPASGGAFTFPDMTGLCQDALANRGGDLEILIKQDADAPGATAEFGFSRTTDSEKSERPRLHVTFTP